MSLRDNAETYGSVSIFNHWLLAAVVIALLVTGVLAGEFLTDEARMAILGPHKAVGVLVLAVILWSAVWRVFQNERPGAIPGTPAPEAFVRKAMHAFLILATVALSLSGVLMATFKGKPVDAYLFVIPAQAKTPWLASMAHDVHVIGGYILLFAVVGHAAVALKHHMVDHDTTFVRMIGKNA